MSSQVLLVEDDSEARKVLTLILKLDGFSVTAVSSGQEAIQAIQAQPPDLLLLDIALPGADGYEICRWTRAYAGSAEIPIVMLAARSEPESIERARAVGADECLVKPIKPSRLVRSVRVLLARAEARMLAASL